MKSLIFDVESTGIPAWTLPSDDPSQPHIVQLAAELCDDTGAVIKRMDRIFNIDVPIPEDVIAIHGITNAICDEVGIPAPQALAEFFALVDESDEVVGHSVSFDIRMVRIMAARHLGVKWECPKPTFDTCTAATPLVKCPPTPGMRGKYKKPTLAECMQFFFGEDIVNAHTANADTAACRRIYYAIQGLAVADASPPIGHNQPPVEEVPSEAVEVSSDIDPFTAYKIDVDDVYGEAKNYLDGAEITTQSEADDVTRIMDLAKKAADAAEAKRVELKKPHDDAAKIVQARWKPLVDRAVNVQTVAKTALGKWLIKVQKDQRDEAARVAKLASDAALSAVSEYRAAQDSGDLTAIENAEESVQTARDILKTADLLEKARPSAKVEGMSRGVGLVTVWKAELDLAEDDKPKPSTLLARWAFARDPERCIDLFMQMAREDVRAGTREIPGVNIYSEQVAR